MRGKPKKVPIRGRPTIATQFIKRGRIPRKVFGGAIGSPIIDENGSPIRDENSGMIMEK